KQMNANVTTKVGLAGTGRMGRAMAGRLLERQLALTVWNRTPERARALLGQGARIAASLAALTSECELILTSLKDDAALEEVYLGPDGLLRTEAQGRLFIDTSTVLPETCTKLANAAARIGASFIDAPVLGTVAPAREGRLVAMVGGAAEEVQR